MIDGTIMKAVSGFYYVKTERGMSECRGKGSFRNSGITPMVGDRVSIMLEDEEKLIGTVFDIYERKNSLVRPPVANVDLLLMVVTIAKPKLNFNQFDKMLILAEKNKIPVSICVNKMDVLKDNDDIDEFNRIYSPTGYDIFCVSAKNGEGVELLKEKMIGKVTALSGNSGVGKSTILNAIKPDFSIPTNDVSLKTQRGRHTTRHTEIFEIDKETYVFDTPGFSSIEFEGIKKDELAYLFPEFRDYLDGCQYRGCSHTKDDGCRVLEALEDGKFHKSRHDNYVLFYKELAKIKDWET